MEIFLLLITPFFYFSSQERAATNINNNNTGDTRLANNKSDRSTSYHKSK